MTEVEICNLALSHIRVKSIASLSDNTPQANECNRLYDPTRDAVLEKFNWNFARKRIILSLKSETYAGWTYAYAYPSDCIKARKIYNSVGESTISGKIKFEVAIDDALTARIILTEQEDAVLIYTARVTTPNMFSSQFVTAMGYAMAVELTVPLRADVALKETMRLEYINIIEQAGAEDANEGHDVPEQVSSFLDAR